MLCSSAMIVQNIMGQIYMLGLHIRRASEGPDISPWTITRERALGVR
jgi:hypothetical protein